MADLVILVKIVLCKKKKTNTKFQKIHRVFCKQPIKSDSATIIRVTRSAILVAWFWNFGAKFEKKKNSLKFSL